MVSDWGVAFGVESFRDDWTGGGSSYDLAASEVYPSPQLVVDLHVRHTDVHWNRRESQHLRLLRSRMLFGMWERNRWREREIIRKRERAREKDVESEEKEKNLLDKVGGKFDYERDDWVPWGPFRDRVGCSPSRWYRRDHEHTADHARSRSHCQSHT